MSPLKVQEFKVSVFNFSVCSNTQAHQESLSEWLQPHAFAMLNIYPRRLRSRYPPLERKYSNLTGPVARLAALTKVPPSLLTPPHPTTPPPPPPLTNTSSVCTRMCAVTRQPAPLFCPPLFLFTLCKLRRSGCGSCRRIGFQEACNFRWPACTLGLACLKQKWLWAL